MAGTYFQQYQQSKGKFVHHQSKPEYTGTSIQSPHVYKSQVVTAGPSSVLSIGATSHDPIPTREVEEPSYGFASASVLNCGAAQEKASAVPKAVVYESVTPAQSGLVNIGQSSMLHFQRPHGKGHFPNYYQQSNPLLPGESVTAEEEVHGTGRRPSWPNVPASISNIGARARNPFDGMDPPSIPRAGVYPGNVDPYRNPILQGEVQKPRPTKTLVEAYHLKMSKEKPQTRSRKPAPADDNSRAGLPSSRNRNWSEEFVPSKRFIPDQDRVTEEVKPTYRKPREESLGGNPILGESYNPRVERPIAKRIDHLESGAEKTEAPRGKKRVDTQLCALNPTATITQHIAAPDPGQRKQGLKTTGTAARYPDHSDVINYQYSGAINTDNSRSCPKREAQSIYEEELATARDEAKQTRDMYNLYRARGEGAPRQRPTTALW